MNESDRSMVPAPSPETGLSAPVEQRGLRIIIWQVLTSTTATSLPPPKPPPDLDEMPTLPRIHACLKFFLLDVEYALSPGGQIRGLAKLACRIALVTGILALCLAFVLSCVAAVLGIVVLITGQIITVLWNLLLAALLVLGLVAVGAVLLLIVRLLLAHR